MEIKKMVSITDANKNFSKVARLCKDLGQIYIIKNNKAVFILKSLDNNNTEMEILDDEKIDIASKRILKKYHKAFEVLAQ